MQYVNGDFENDCKTRNKNFFVAGLLSQVKLYFRSGSLLCMLALHPLDSFLAANEALGGSAGASASCPVLPAGGMAAYRKHLSKEMRLL